MAQEYLSEWGIVVAVLAFIWSIVGFALNRIYTNRVLRSSTLPVLRLRLHHYFKHMAKNTEGPAPYTYDLGTNFSYRIANQSDEVSLSWYKTTATLYRLKRCLWFWRRGRCSIYSTRMNDWGLKPRGYGHGFLQPDLEEFVHGNLPGVLRLERKPRPHYVVEDSGPLELKIEILYQPAKVATKPVVKRQLYRITPTEEEIPAEVIGSEEIKPFADGVLRNKEYWRVEELLRKNWAR